MKQSVEGTHKAFMDVHAFKVHFIVILYVLSYFYKLLRPLSLSKMVVESSLKLVYSTIGEENFKIYCVHIPRKCTECRHFYSCTQHSETAPSSCHPKLGRGKLPIPSGSILSKICFIQQQKGVEESMIWFSKIQQEI